MYKMDLKCPNCNKKIRAKVYSEVGILKITEILDESLFMVECKNCNTKIKTDYPLKFETDDYIITYNIKDIDSNKRIRICDTFDDFKEKILIFEDGYNDILIEFMKDYIIENAKLDGKVLRFDSSNEDNIIFTILGDYNNVGLPVSFYDDLKKQAKLKEASIINHDNYIKYMKL